jgi:hypothetical protein
VIAGAAGLVFAAADDTFQGISVKPPYDARTHSGKAKPTPAPQVVYHGGPVMNGTNSVYVIYYGAFEAKTQSIINDFLFGLSGSPQYMVNSSYDAGGNPPSIPGSYAFQVTAQYIFNDSYSQGSQLGTSSVPKIVANAINKGLPNDPNGVYLVVTAPDVKIAGFCSSYCAYHNDTNIALAGATTAHIRFALIPDPTQRCSACNGGIAIYGDTTSPNGDTGADTMTDDIMHELSETVTDPDISAWYTQNGAEVADLCNYVYGDTSVVQVAHNALGTYHYNASLPSSVVGAPNRQYLIQQIWKNTPVQACASK